ncbi:hypothetical protein HJFPF1_08114 [Paramyrothecium foliicola]|nr:hypothetical protein HJFPF1_08114 [Paramyrothecium foliicola]
MEDASVPKLPQGPLPILRGRTDDLFDDSDNDLWEPPSLVVIINRIIPRHPACLPACPLDERKAAAAQSGPDATHHLEFRSAPGRLIGTPATAVETQARLVQIPPAQQWYGETNTPTPRRPCEVHLVLPYPMAFQARLFLETC